jgi:Cu+-exporting ATPase
MKVNPQAPKGGTYEYGGHTYFFCNPKCQEKFRADPQKYLKPEAEEPPAAPPGTMYVCPMDPEVRQDHPGACPKCGMALEPEAPVVETKTEYVCPMHPEVVQDHPGSCPKCGMALEPRTVMAEEKPDPELISMTRRFWVSLALSIPVVFLGMSDRASQCSSGSHRAPWRGRSSCWPRRWCCGAVGLSSSAVGRR